MSGSLGLLEMELVRAVALFSFSLQVADYFPFCTWTSLALAECDP